MNLCCAGLTAAILSVQRDLIFFWIHWLTLLLCLFQACHDNLERPEHILASPTPLSWTKVTDAQDSSGLLATSVFPSQLRALNSLDVSSKLLAADDDRLGAASPEECTLMPRSASLGNENCSQMNLSKGGPRISSASGLSYLYLPSSPDTSVKTQGNVSLNRNKEGAFQDSGSSGRKAPKCKSAKQIQVYAVHRKCICF